MPSKRNHNPRVDASASGLLNTIHFDSTTSAAHQLSTEDRGPSVTELLLSSFLLNHEREIYGMIDEHFGEFRPLPEPSCHQESNQFNKQTLKLGSKYLYLMVDAKRTIFNSASISSSDQKLILTLAQGDKSRGEELLKYGGLLGHIDRRTKLFVPSKIITAQRGISRSKSKERLHGALGFEKLPDRSLDRQKLKLNQSS